MKILLLRTDNPLAELGLYENHDEIKFEKWEAHMKLAETIHHKIKEILTNSDTSLTDLEGIVIFCGPGSFTGLRIGLSVANALACSLSIPIVGSTGDGWVQLGIKSLLAGNDAKMVLPEYGAGVRTTTQKK